LLWAGNKSKIEHCREKKSIEKTKKVRPGLLKK
jgi:tRNA G37 N-methylase TrmD